MFFRYGFIRNKERAPCRPSQERTCSESPKPSVPHSSLIHMSRESAANPRRDAFTAPGSPIGWIWESLALVIDSFEYAFIELPHRQREGK